jgi:hypothetical protein
MWDFMCFINSIRISKHRKFVRGAFGWCTRNRHGNFAGLKRERERERERE